jgi:hypothetical protein
MTPRYLLAALCVAAGPLLGAGASAQTCGNGIIETPEACDPPGSISCPAGSPGGAFLACAADCTCPGAEPLNAFACYGARLDGRVQEDVTLVDQFGTYSAGLRRLNALCAPADVGGNDATAPDDPGHLARYALQTRGRFPGVTEQVVVNQFGTITVDVSGKPKDLLVPTAKSLTGPPSPLGAFVDHFTCHRVKPSKGTPRFPGADDVTIETQFETVTIDVRKPRSLCAPTNKNGEDPGAENGVDHLLCYQISSKGGPGRPDVFLNNQFGQQSGRLGGQRRELCVPSLKNPGSTTTTSTSTTTAPTTTTSTSTTVPTTSTTSTTAPTTTTSSTTTSTTTTSTTTTTLYGSPSRAFIEPVADLLD